MKNIVVSLIIGAVSIINFQGLYAQIPGKPQKKSILITGGTIHIGNGTVIDNGAIGFKDGKIILVEDNSKIKVDRPAFDTIIDVTGKHVYPGLIAPNITLGLSEIDAVRATNDFAETGDILPNVRSLISYNTDSRITPTVRSNGVLVVQSTPRYGLISGTSSVMDLDGWNWEDAMHKADDGLHLNWPRMFSRTGSWEDPGPFEKNKGFDKRIETLSRFFDDAAAYSKIKVHPEKNLKLEAMRGLFDGTKALYIHTHIAKEITDGILFAKRYGVQRTVLVGGKEAWMVLDFLKQHQIPVIISRVHDLPERTEDDVDLPYKLAGILKTAGILYCLSNEGDMENMGSRNLPFHAGTTAAYGLSKEEALMSVTLNAAKILGVDATLGTIEKGKDATIVISTGDLLDIRSNNVERAFIHGRTIDLDNHQKALYRKYMVKYGLK